MFELMQLLAYECCASLQSDADIAEEQQIAQSSEALRVEDLVSFLLVCLCTFVLMLSVPAV